MGAMDSALRAVCGSQPTTRIPTTTLTTSEVSIGMCIADTGGHSRSFLIPVGPGC